MGKCFSVCMGLSSSNQRNQGRPSFTRSTGPTHFTSLQNDQKESVSTAVTSANVIPTQAPESAAVQTSTSSSEKKSISTSRPHLVLSLKANNGMDQSKRLSFPTKEVSDSKLASLFENYRDSEEEDCILAEGIEKFCDDLNVSPEDFRILVLAWKFNAQTMCKFSRVEFVTGCKAIKADSIRVILSKLPDLVKEVKDTATFREFYKWTFKFGVDSEVGQRTLPRDIAMSLWQLVFSQNKPQILDRWLNFLEVHPSIKGISKDTWDMFLNFTEVIGDDLSHYDDAEAWPSLFDDFVEYENDRQNQNVTSIDGEQQ